MTQFFAGKARIAILAAAGMAAPLPSLAHHSFAMYDNKRTVVLDGVVREFKWTNPHGAILLTVERGRTSVEYNIELSSLNAMSRQGWNRRTLRAGERLRVSIHPLRDGTNGGSFAGAVKADGTVLRSTAPR